MSLLTLNGVSFSYDKKTPVIKNVSLEVNEGEFVALGSLALDFVDVVVYFLREGFAVAHFIGERPSEQSDNSRGNP